MHVVDFAVQVRPIAVADAVSAAVSEIDWRARLHCDDARDLPATERGLQEMARAVAEHGDAVDEVGGKIVGPVENARPKVIPPSHVGIGDSIQVLTAAAGGWIDGA